MYIFYNKINVYLLYVTQQPQKTMLEIAILLCWAYIDKLEKDGVRKLMKAKKQTKFVGTTEILGTLSNNL